VSAVVPVQFFADEADRFSCLGRSFAAQSKRLKRRKVPPLKRARSSLPFYLQ
jgi:hypothetical protein